MAICIRANALLSRLKALLTLQRFNHGLADGGPPGQLYADIDSDSASEQGQSQFLKWRKYDSRSLGITRSMISESSLIVLKILQSKGFESYLVGGCVRDLLLRKTPKDFDVITTAALKQIRKQFHRAVIIGQRFPICRVHVKGSFIEVSSFETVAQHAEGKEKFLVSQMPRGCDKFDLLRWRNCMHRDFTINSLFLNPFVNKIYDYANGMMDLMSSELRTLVPAQLSFKEDCARILRGLRIAARLDLSFSKDAETAIHEHSSSVMCLAKSRIMMELNYMLSYGAAQPSLCLLYRFGLLEGLLPFHAAYLAQQASKSGKKSTMLMKLFFNLDRLVTCDRPSDSSLWVGLLAFHLALVHDPQHPLIVLALASVLYHGKWKEGVEYARQHAQTPISFVPEFSEAFDFISDAELTERVIQLALLVQDSIDVLTETDSLLAAMARFPGFPCSGLVFVPKKTGRDVTELFNMLVHDVESYKEQRKSFEIDYRLLGKGYVCETRFVLGKIIMDTIGCGVVQGGEVIEEEKYHSHTLDHELEVEVFEENCHPRPDLEKRHTVRKNDKKGTILPSNSQLQQESAKKQELIGKQSNLSVQGRSKKQKEIVNEKLEEIAEEDQDLFEKKKCQEVAKKHQKVVGSENGCQSPQWELIRMQENLLKKEKWQLRQEKWLLRKQGITGNKQKGVEDEKYQEMAEKHLKVVEQVKCHVSQDEVTKKQQNSVEKYHLSQEKEKHKQHMTREKGSRLPLSSLFK